MDSKKTKKKKLTKTITKFSNEMQKIVNKSKGGITKITMGVNGEEYTIAKRKTKS